MSRLGVSILLRVYEGAQGDLRIQYTEVMFAAAEAGSSYMEACRHAESMGVTTLPITPGEGPHADMMIG